MKNDEVKNVKIFMDGNKICALIGEDLQVGNAGFGDSESEALRELADDLEKN